MNLCRSCLLKIYRAHTLYVSVAYINDSFPLDITDLDVMSGMVLEYYRHNLIYFDGVNAIYEGENGVLSLSVLVVSIF